MRRRNKVEKENRSFYSHKCDSTHCTESSTVFDASDIFTFHSRSIRRRIVTSINVEYVYVCFCSVWVSRVLCCCYDARTRLTESSRFAVHNSGTDISNHRNQKHCRSVCIVTFGYLRYPHAMYVVVFALRVQHRLASCSFSLCICVLMFGDCFWLRFSVSRCCCCCCCSFIHILFFFMFFVRCPSKCSIVSLGVCVCVSVRAERRELSAL